MMYTQKYVAVIACMAAFVAVTLGNLDDAEACGGFFCSQQSPVLQSAERIIFSDNDDGTVTALVQILYEGPSERFAWMLPVPGEPEIGLSSNVAFERLQEMTNPQYTLVTVNEDSCQSGTSSTANGTTASSNGTTVGTDNVVVVASGEVGPYDYTLLTTNSDAVDPSIEVLTWLRANGYDITATTPALLRPYLEAGMNLLAFRLTKGKNTGDIRPVRLTYAMERPMIPITLTSVAASENMDVLVWVLASSRVVPTNYRSLVLNEALIDWFNPDSTYKALVSLAADEAGGQGFVTEMAGPTDPLRGRILTHLDSSAWEDLRISWREAQPSHVLASIFRKFGDWDGLEDAARVLFPDLEPEVFEDVLNCAARADALSEGLEVGEPILCETLEGVYPIDLDELFAEGFIETFIDVVDSNVIAPVQETQALLNAQPYITRLYTTLSGDEMTVDPEFGAHPGLDDVSNLHTAIRHLSCDANTGYAWRVELPQGGVVHSETSAEIWPHQPAVDMTANLQVLQAATSGEPEVIADNTEAILQFLEEDRPVGTVEPEDAPTRPSNPVTPDSEAEQGPTGQGTDVENGAEPSEEESVSGCTSTPSQRASNGGLMFAMLVIAGLLGVWRR